ncbi:hypothetical protein K9M16_01440 [Candidatus Babeliales bacterium]|nr:hypothetical protein [Candidatus Babeliales bacterium]
MNFIINFTCKNKKIILSLIIFILVFGILGLPFTKWGFSTVDDFPVFLHSQITSLKNMFLGDISAWDVLAPYNFDISKETSFFSAYYRPMMFFSYYVGSIFFGDSAYGHFLFTIFLHALNSVILFNIFSSICSYLIAFLISMFFAFNPSYADWMGWIAAQQYPMGLFFLLISILFFKNFLDKKKLIFFILSSLFYLLTILGKEVLIIFPIIAFFAAYLYETKYLGIKISGVIKNIFRYLFLTLNYWVALLIYFCLRAYIFSINFSQVSSGNLFSFTNIIYFFQSKIYYLFVIFTDLFGLWFVPWGCPLIKSLFYLIIFLAFIWLFIKSSQKLILIYCLFSITILWWPIILGYYSRYLYESIPFVCLYFLFGMKFYSGNISTLLKKIFFIFFSFYLILNIFYLFINLKFREENSFIINKTFDLLACDSNLKNRNLCFIGVPSKFSPGCERAISLKNKDYSTIILHDLDLVSCVSGKTSKMQEIFGVKIKHYFDANEILENNFLKIKKIENGFKFVSSNPEKIWFIKRDLSGGYLPVGMAILDKVTKNNKIYDVSLIINNRWLKLNPVFITWDYVNQKFKILGELNA